ncbi:pentatricopeptide repeat-containing protein At2g29760, chloroplastic-like [Pyrus communis]|uniref:pentatricopeptide repeat-containing protein At2g29760, chloroplastic-like n=1 Tax=Pyrus communis TaxID=23211 RepID=UPI0035BF06BB
MATLSTPRISLPRHPPNPPSPTATNDLHFSSDPSLSSIDHCTSIKQLKQVHAQMLRTGLLFDPYYASKLITVCALSSSAKVKPNSVILLLWHARLVDEGRTYFYQMEPVYGVVPGLKHYACMVDILGRSGNLEEAVELIEKMPIAPTASESSHMLELDPSNHRVYVLLSNIYAKTGKWEEVSGLRKRTRDAGIKKEPLVIALTLCAKKYIQRDEIAERLKSNGYVPNKSHLLQFVEEEDHALILHSEKLGIAFGLIILSPSQAIQVVKNLRVCGDCHAAAKLISRVNDREILLRDRYRFHNFRDGHCSCNVYW